MHLIGVGSSNTVNTATAAAECVRAALAASGEQPPGWGIAFCGGRHDPTPFLDKVHEIAGPIPVIGGAAVGTITSQQLGYSGFETALALFPADLGAPALLVEEGLSGQEFAVGQRLGQRLRETAPDHATVLLFYDSVDIPTSAVRLHVGTWLMNGLYAELGAKPLHLVGGGALGEFNFSAVAHIFAGQKVERHAALAAVLPPTLRGYTRIFHGTVPASAFLTITRIEGATVYELDGQPALDVLQAIVGEEAFAAPMGQPILLVTLGAKHGDLFAPYDEAAYANRLILSHDPVARSITLFEPDFRVGAKVQVMLRSGQWMLESAERGMASLMEELRAATPLLGLYVNCAGRAALLSGTETEEAASVVAGIGGRFPLLGFYSGVEIAPFRGRSQPLDWTGVLTVLCRTDAPLPG